MMSAFPALGQDTHWFVYVYNGRELVRVYQDATQEAFTLGVDENTFVGSQDMAFSADGSRVAFCATTYPPAVEGQASPPPAPRLYLRDIAAQSNLLDVDLGSAIGCRVGQRGMSPDGALVAVGLIHHLPGDPAADASKPTWQLLVLDTAAGSIAYELNDQSPNAASMGVPAGGVVMPFVQNVDASSIIFAPVPWFTEGFIDAAYRWHLDTGAIDLESGEQWRQFNPDILPATGEAAWAVVDPNLPAYQPMAIGLASNVVKVSDAGGQVTTIYHNGEANPGDARFINNGHQVAILLSPRFDETNPSAPVEYRWLAVDRAGSVADLATDANFSYLEGAPDGFVRLVWDSPDQNPSNATYRLLYTANGQTTELWTMTSAGGDQYVTWELAWAAPMPAAGGLPPFTPIAS